MILIINKSENNKILENIIFLIIKYIFEHFFYINLINCIYFILLSENF